MKKYIQKSISIIFLCGGIGFGFLLYANFHILSYSSYIEKDITALPKQNIVLVFGGGMKEDGSMSNAQTDRVVRAVELYKNGKVKRMIMTGDNGARRFNEVDAMKAHAITLGVPKDIIDIDGHGYNTYTSCYRAKYDWELDQVIAISQTFHLPRILYFCNEFGVKTIGVAADITPSGLVGNVWHTNMREKLARLKGWIQKEVTHPEPLMFGTKKPR